LWEASDIETEALAAKTIEKTFPNKYAFPIICLVALVIIISSVLVFKPQTKTDLFKKITPLTATDHWEYLVSFSPDGRYLAFNRHLDIHNNQVWIKDLVEQQEYLLTSHPGRYTRAAWSPDGLYLAVALHQVGSSKEQDRDCASLELISFTLVKSGAQSSTKLISCQQRNYRSVSWLSNHQLVFIDEKDDTQSVNVLDINSGELTSLYSDKKQRLSSLAYSRKTGKLAIMQRDLFNKGSLHIIDMTFDKSHTVALKYPAQYSSRVSRLISWHPKLERLITSEDNTIFEIDLDGNFIPHVIATTQFITSPVYHPDGNSVVATMGHMDMDISQLNWSPELSPEQSQRVLHRSIVSEFNGKYQPFTDNVAFVSRRSGEFQMWLSEGDQINAITNFPSGSYIKSYAWSTDGKLLALNVEQQLHLLSPNSEIRKVTVPFKVLSIFQWTSANSLLLKISDGQQQQVVEYDINTHQSEVLFDGQVKWAQIDSKSLFVLGQDGVIKAVTNGKIATIDELTGTRALAPFFVQDQHLVLLDGHNAIWSYKTDTQTKQLIHQGDGHINHLDDVRLTHKKLIFTRYISGKKDLVMFHP